ncbi:MAG: hypothetical protein ACI4I4_07610 [Acutalibacteraceae bacterium]
MQLRHCCVFVACNSKNIKRTVEFFAQPSFSSSFKFSSATLTASTTMAVNVQLLCFYDMIIGKTAFSVICSVVP